MCPPSPAFPKLDKFKMSFLGINAAPIVSKKRRIVPPTKSSVYSMNV